MNQPVGQNHVIGRIAPSPTGRMHIGNAYAALAAWLGARAAGGLVRLRIEDIDGPRVVPDADRWIQDDLAWLGLDWDGPVVYQSQRVDLYREALRRLEAQSLRLEEARPVVGVDTALRTLIYPCFCSRADIRAASAPNEGDGFIVYPGTCRRLPPSVARERVEAGRRHAFRIAVPDEGRFGSICEFRDKVYGLQSYDLPRQVGDVVLLRSDGLVSYQLAVSVDDLEMGISQVVRGRDLLRSTAIQLWVRRRLLFRQREGGPANSMRTVSIEDTKVPQVEWAHLPLVDGADGRRMSKRFGSLDLGSLREAGVAPEQVVGLCAWLLGLTERPEPASPSSLLPRFSWEQVRANLEDRLLTHEALAAAGIRVQ
nr:glutamyl-Q tRNA(Asp) synthetase [Bifidobacterium xylocopae]